MNDAAKTGYDVAIKLTDVTARKIWRVYGVLLATNGFLVSLSAFSFLATQTQFKPIMVKGIGVFGLLVCLSWFLITMRSCDYYRYYFAWARKLEEEAFGNSVEMIRMGAKFANGEQCFIGTSPERMRWGSRLFKAEWLIYVVIVMFSVIYGYLVVDY